jgi:hypothetical protein
MLQCQYIGNSDLTLVNQTNGRMNANSSGNTLYLNGSGGVTNQGTLEATGGGILNISNMTVNDQNDSIQANGGNVQILNPTINGGALTATVTATGGGTFNAGVNGTTVYLNGSTSDAWPRTFT